MKKRFFLQILLLIAIVGPGYSKSGIFNNSPGDKQKVANTLKFSVDSLTFVAYSGGTVVSQSVSVSASTGTPAVTLSVTGLTWITPPAGKIGAISFGSSNIHTDLLQGNYVGKVVASASGYSSATLSIRLLIIDGITTQPINVNFQDHTTVPPDGWYRDFGQGFGLRTGAYQSIGKQFGWRKRSDGTKLEMTSNGFNRLVPEDVTLSTLIYMQANNVTGTFPGSKIQAYWEMKVPNGSYDVTVSVGDGKVDNAVQKNYINVEGVRAITNFTPTGIAGASTRFRQATVRVAVKDENLTINADGGTNTRINYAQISPVSISPFIGWSNNNINIIIQKGSKTAKKFSVLIGNSSNTSGTYNISTSYGSNSGWLSFKTSVNGVTPLIDFNYLAGANLPIGTYTATIKATRSGFSSDYINVQLRVIDANSPYVISSSPANGDFAVNPAIVSVAANNLHVPVVAGFKGGVDNSTITNNTVKLYKIVNGVSNEVPGVVQGTGGGDAISFSPKTPLLISSTYKLSISNGVKSYSGAAFIPFTSTFVTDENPPEPTNPLPAQFTKVPIPGTQGKSYTNLTFGPDGKFYALRLDGVIERYTVNHTDGSLSNQQLITTLTTKYGARSAIGLVFNPSSTASNLICYVTHSSSGLTNSPSFDGNLSQLTGPDLGTEKLLITKLPRSSRDHMANSMAFGPDGALYLCQGSNSSAGAFDNDWQRAESLLSGCVLRLALSKLNSITLPLNVQTTTNQNVINSASATLPLMSDGTYNPYSSNSPLTIYASGVRNAYSLVWHTNGQLYVPTNGSGGGGNSPASVAGTRRPDGTFYNGPVIPATTGVQVQVDWLFRINPLKGVGYFGHPNPLRGQYVENRGYLDNPLYPATIVPDVSYRGAAYNFGLNHSPDGVIEYKSSTFKGVLKNKLLVCRFSGGGDIVVMEPGSKVKIGTITANSVDTIYNITKVTTGAGNNGLVGMSGFVNPLNLVEDTTNGNIYVIEYNWNSIPGLISQITLLKVSSSSSAIQTQLSLKAEKGVDDPGLISYKNFEVKVYNKGDDDLKIKDISVTGPEAGQYQIKGIPLPQKENPLIMKKNTSLLFTASVPISSYTNKPATVRVTSIDDTVKEVTLVDDTAGKNKIAFASDSLKLADSLRKDQVALRVYPNPNKGDKVTVELFNFKKQEAVVISLYNLEGRKLKSTKVKTDLNGAYTTSIPLTPLHTSHLLIVTADSPTEHKESKVIIEGSN